MRRRVKLVGAVAASLLVLLDDYSTVSVVNAQYTFKFSSGRSRGEQYRRHQHEHRHGRHGGFYGSSSGNRRESAREQQQFVGKDYYRELGLGRRASTEDIRRAYKKLAREWHPDRNTSPGAEEKFVRINEAHEVLSDDGSRRRYDAAIGHGGRGRHDAGSGGFGSRYNDQRRWKQEFERDFSKRYYQKRGEQRQRSSFLGDGFWSRAIELLFISVVPVLSIVVFLIGGWGDGDDDDDDDQGHGANRAQEEPVSDSRPLYERPQVDRIASPEYALKPVDLRRPEEPLLFLFCVRRLINGSCLNKYREMQLANICQEDIISAAESDDVQLPRTFFSDPRATWVAPHLYAPKANDAQRLRRDIVNLSNAFNKDPLKIKLLECDTSVSESVHNYRDWLRLLSPPGIDIGSFHIRETNEAGIRLDAVVAIQPKKRKISFMPNSCTISASQVEERVSLWINKCLNGEISYTPIHVLEEESDLTESERDAQWPSLGFDS